MISDGWVSERLREAAKRLPGVAKRLPGQADLLGVQPDVVGAGVCIFSKVSAASSSRPARASASAYQNVHSENVRSSPRNPSGDAPGLYRFTRLSETSVESIAWRATLGQTARQSPAAASAAATSRARRCRSAG